MAKHKETPDTGRQPQLKEQVKVKPPAFYRVLLHNDDYTTMEFVVNILVNLFNKTQEEATQVMLSVHNNGKAVAGIYSRDIAETKVDQVTKLARQNQFPLKASMEKE